MKYYEVNFRIDAPEELLQDARDLLAALAGEAGFETFEDTPGGVTGYVQQALFSDELLRRQLQLLPLPGVAIDYDVAAADDKDWNEEWEQSGFEPIIIGRQCVVHDGRHLPQTADACAMSIEIDAHMAFGTGTHQTTQMMLASLLQLPLQGLSVLDCGCGTGILGIAALKAGAERCTSYDIDEWSVENTRHNAVINAVDHRLTVLPGDSAVLDSLPGQYEVIMANINRNILLADLPVFCRRLAACGHLLLSGFYQTDAPLLIDAAAGQGLTLASQTAIGDWACLHFTA